VPTANALVLEKTQTADSQDGRGAAIVMLVHADPL
jgi:hypothetical protein